MSQIKDDFIMLPTVDFCFKELMQNPKVRQGFIAALLNVNPNEIYETELLPTILRKEAADDKFGILDVWVLLRDGIQMDMEMQVVYFEHWDKRILYYLSKMFTEQLQKGDPYDDLQKCIHVSILDFIHFPNDSICYRTIHLREDESGELYTDLFELQILELKKLPPEIKSGEDILKWMKFFSGKTRKEFSDMAKDNEYMEEAYQALLEISADEQKRLEYETREKALKDYNSQINSALRRGQKLGIQLTIDVVNASSRGDTPEKIAEDKNISLEQVNEILAGINKE